MKNLLDLNKEDLVNIILRKDDVYNKIKKENDSLKRKADALYKENGVLLKECNHLSEESESGLSLIATIGFFVGLMVGWLIGC